MKVKKLVYGVGVNDADYNVQKFETVGYTDSGKHIQKLVWICPFYRKWRDMLSRCYSEKLHLKFPNYRGCYVIAEWHSFVAFRDWMIEQDWEGKELDKDILFPGNKVYGPDTCVFVDQKVNLFLTESTASRGEWPVGVSYDKIAKKFKAQCHSVITGKRKSLGYFKNPDEAHRAWLSFKLEQAKILAEQQNDFRIAKALIERYENYVAL